MADEHPSTNTVLLAFMLTMIAGLATTIGSSTAFFVVLQNKTLLAVGLSLSAGVMIYVSFVEIFATKAFDAFEESIGEHYAMPVATGYFFAGMLTCWLLNFIVHHMFGHHHSHDIDDIKGPGLQELDSVVSTEQPPTVQRRNNNNNNNSSTATDGSETDLEVEIMTVDDVRMERVRKERAAKAAAVATAAAVVSTNGPSATASQMDVNGPDEELHKTGMMTAIAIALHNWPEGLATFVATLDDPSVGIAIAVAIALHNIPEGVCVAMPIYYASGSRWKAFWWSFFSGMTEPIGALLGYFLLRKVFSQQVYGVLFSLVAGMMIYISFAELLPTAIKYQDPKRPWIVPFGVFTGMFAMAISLVLFQL